MRTILLIILLFFVTYIGFGQNFIKPNYPDTCNVEIIDTCYIPLVSNVDSLKFYIFRLENKISYLNVRLDSANHQIMVDNLILNQAGGHFGTAGGGLISALLIGGAGVISWYLNENNGDYTIGYGLVFVGASLAGFSAYHLWRGGIKLSWVGKQYRIVE